MQTRILNEYEWEINKARINLIQTLAITLGDANFEDLLSKAKVDPIELSVLEKCRQFRRELSQFHHNPSYDDIFKIEKMIQGLTGTLKELQTILFNKIKVIIKDPEFKNIKDSHMPDSISSLSFKSLFSTDPTAESVAQVNNLLESLKKLLTVDKVSLEIQKEFQIIPKTRYLNAYISLGNLAAPINTILHELSGLKGSIGILKNAFTREDLYKITESNANKEDSKHAREILNYIEPVFKLVESHDPEKQITNTQLQAVSISQPVSKMDKENVKFASNLLKKLNKPDAVLRRLSAPVHIQEANKVEAEFKVDNANKLVLLATEIIPTLNLSRSKQAEAVEFSSPLLECESSLQALSDKLKQMNEELAPDAAVETRRIYKDKKATYDLWSAERGHTKPFSPEIPFPSIESLKKEDYPSTKLGYSEAFIEKFNIILYSFADMGMVTHINKLANELKDIKKELSGDIKTLMNERYLHVNLPNKGKETRSSADEHRYTPEFIQAKHAKLEQRIQKLYNVLVLNKPYDLVYAQATDKRKEAPKLKETKAESSTPETTLGFLATSPPSSLTLIASVTASPLLSSPSSLLLMPSSPSTFSFLSLSPQPPLPLSPSSSLSPLASSPGSSQPPLPPLPPIPPFSLSGTSSLPESSLPSSPASPGTKFTKASGMLSSTQTLFSGVANPTMGVSSPAQGNVLGAQSPVAGFPTNRPPPPRLTPEQLEQKRLARANPLFVYDAPIKSSYPNLVEHSLTPQQPTQGGDRKMK